MSAPRRLQAPDPNLLSASTEARAMESEPPEVRILSRQPVHVDVAEGSGGSHTGQAGCTAAPASNAAPGRGWKEVTAAAGRIVMLRSGKEGRG